MTVPVRDLRRLAHLAAIDRDAVPVKVVDRTSVNHVTEGSVGSTLAVDRGMVGQDGRAHHDCVVAARVA